MQTAMLLFSKMVYASESWNSAGCSSLEQYAEVSEMVRMFQ